MDFFMPRISADSRAFWQGCAQHRLLFQKCKKCGKVRWPASLLCPDCLSDETEQVELWPEGTLYSYVVMEKPFHPSLKDKVPYILAEVDLSDGVRVLANVDIRMRENLRCGMPVRLAWHDGEGFSKPMIAMKESDSCDL